MLPVSLTILERHRVALGAFLVLGGAYIRPRGAPAVQEGACGSDTVAGFTQCCGFSPGGGGTGLLLSSSGCSSTK